jgi:hypothetical protein
VGIRVHLTERRATENYFTDPAVKAALGNKHTALGAYDKLTVWFKRDNWQIAGRMARTDLDATDVGQFLATLRASPGA